MNESGITANQLAALAELDELFSARAIEYWLFGGWAVDFHVGRVTRLHGDIDMAIWRDNLTDVVTLLHDGAWIHQPDINEDGYTGYERRGVRLEIANLARDEHGVVYTPVQDGRAEWPAEAFAKRSRTSPVSARGSSVAHRFSSKSPSFAPITTRPRKIAQILRISCSTPH